METFDDYSITRLPASRFPDPADIYYCDGCGRDLTKHLHPDRAPVWQPLGPMWYVCQCHRKYFSGAAEWDDLSAWERYQRIWQLRIGFVLLALLIIPATLVYFAVSYGSPALLLVVGIALIPAVLVARPFGFVLLDLYEIIASICRTRLLARWHAEPSLSPKSGEEEVETTQPVAAQKLRPGLRSSRLAAVVVVLIVAAVSIPYYLRPVVPAGASSSPQESNPASQEIVLAPTKPAISLATQTAATERAVPGVPSRAFRRIRVSPDEVDDVAEDVTIRHFIPQSAPLQVQLAYREVNIGRDVTMRYFASNPAVTPRTRPLVLPVSK